MINGTHHVAISTGNLERLVGFYRDLFGFEVFREAGWPAGSALADLITGLKNSEAKNAHLQAGSISLEIFEFKSPKPKPMDPERPVCDHGFTHICFQVTDIEEEYERLKRGGMKFNCPPQNLGGAKATYGRDPDGNVIELLEVNSPG